MDVNSDSLLPPNFETASGKTKIRVEDNGPSKLSVLRLNSTAEDNAAAVLFADTNLAIITTDLAAAAHPRLRERSYFHVTVPEVSSESDDDSYNSRDAFGPSSTEAVRKSTATEGSNSDKGGEAQKGTDSSKSFVFQVSVSHPVQKMDSTSSEANPVLTSSLTASSSASQSATVLSSSVTSTPFLVLSSSGASSGLASSFSPFPEFPSTWSSSASSSGLTISSFPESRCTGKSVFGLSAFSQPSTSSSSFADISSKSSISANPSLPGGTSNLALHNSLADHIFQFFPRRGATTPAFEISVNVYLEGLTFSVTADTIGSLKTGIMKRLSWTDLDLNRRILVPDYRNFKIPPIPIFDGRNLLESEDESSLYCLGLQNRETLVLGLKCSFIISLLMPTRYISRPYDIKEISVKPYDTVRELKRKIELEAGEPATEDNIPTNFFVEGIDNKPILSLGFYPIASDKNKRRRLFSIKWTSLQLWKLGVLTN